MKLNKNNYVIGLTGGVGAGKSTIMYILENEFGARVYQADRISRSLTQKGQPAFEPVVELFGEEILMPDGNPDRNRMAHIVFEDEEKRLALNAIIHPAVVKFLRGKAEKRDGLVVIEAALPREAKFEEYCDEIWYVYADEETRIKRVVESRGYSREKAEEIIASQLSDNEFRELADVVIDNSTTLENTEKQVEANANRCLAIIEKSRDI